MSTTVGGRDSALSAQCSVLAQPLRSHLLFFTLTYCKFERTWTNVPMCGIEPKILPTPYGPLGTDDTSN